MDYQTLGRTGLTVSAIGIGTGGPSRIGAQTGTPRSQSIRIIREALDVGVNFIDTAEAYRTEEIVGEAISEVPRETVIVSTKVSNWNDLDQAGLTKNIEERLVALRTDYLDICHLHGVTHDTYPRVINQLYPALVAAREAGKIRCLGVTELFNREPAHQMLNQAVSGDLWDVIMVGFNLLNQSARSVVLPQCMKHGIGVLAMFAVRRGLSNQQVLVEIMSGLLDQGIIDHELFEKLGGSLDDPLGFVVKDGDPESLVEAAYRFVRHEPGIDVTLSGTGNIDHMRANIAAVQRPPLDQPLLQNLRQLFAEVDSVTGQ